MFFIYNFRHVCLLGLRLVEFSLLRRYLRWVLRNSSEVMCLFFWAALQPCLLKAIEHSRCCCCCCCCCCCLVASKLFVLISSWLASTDGPTSEDFKGFTKVHCFQSRSLRLQAHLPNRVTWFSLLTTALLTFWCRQTKSQAAKKPLLLRSFNLSQLTNAELE